MRVAACLAGAVLIGSAAAADVLRVVADIGPVHSLAAQVMDGVGEPTLLLPPEVSPHDYAMKPSDAAMLTDAGVVFWIGGALTPWLGRSLDQLADGAVVVELGHAEGTVTRRFREGAAFADHAHDDEHGHTASLDPHLWLDPENARVWLVVMAETLAAADPGNADRYHANAEAAAGGLDRLTADIGAVVEPVRGRPFVVLHDAYHYFETRFAIEAAGAIALGDAQSPGPRRLEEIRDAIRDLGAICVFAEPQFDARLVDAATEGSAARVATLDPVGATLQPGPGLYAALLSNLARDLAGCLGR